MGATVTPDVGALVLTGIEPQVNSGPMVTPAVGALTLTGFAPSTSLAQQYLAYRVVIPGIGSSFQPGDPDPLPDTDFYITSKRLADHPWIAQRDEGPTATVDYAPGGQRLDPTLGHAVDGEVQIRLIDVPAPVSTVACDVDSILLAEGSAGATYGLDANAFTTGGWVIDSNWLPGEPPASGWSANANGPIVSTFALFNWFPFSGGPWVRGTWISKRFDGTEQGGPAWTIGQIVGFKFRVNWTLDTGGGNAFVKVVSGSGPSTQVITVPGMNSLFDFWDIPVEPLNNQVDSAVYIVVDDMGSGPEVEIWMGAEGMYPSFNLTVQFEDIQVIACDTIITSVASERYITGWLADSNARQQLLGRRAFFEQSTNGGTDWSSVVYAGYVKQLTMEQSLTYLLTIGDSGRGRRVSRAFAGLNPVEDFTP